MQECNELNIDTTVSEKFWEAFDQYANEKCFAPTFMEMCLPERKKQEITIIIKNARS